MYISLYGSVRFTSYFKFVANSEFHTVLQEFSLVQECWLLGFTSGQVFPNSGLLRGRGAPEDPARCTCGIEADAILSPRCAGWAGVTIEVDYWWVPPGGWVLHNHVFELSMAIATLGAHFELGRIGITVAFQLWRI